MCTGGSGEKVRKKNKTTQEGLWEKRLHRGTQPASTTTKVNNWTVIHNLNQIWETFNVHLGSFSNTVEQKNENNYAGKKGRKFHFACINTSPELATQYAK